MNKLVVPFPAQTSDRAAVRIAEELRESGIEAKAVRNGGELLLEVKIAAENPRIVWVETIADGQRRWHARVIVEPAATPVGALVDPQLAAGDGDGPARGEGESDLGADEQSERLGIAAPSAVESCNMGLELLAAGEYRNAIKAFNVAIAADATFAGAHVGKGDALKALGYYPEAVQSYSRALEIDSRLSAAYTGRGLCFLAVSPPDYDLALNDFQNALDLDRDNIVALLSVGRIYAENAQNPQRAIAFLSEALQLDAKNAGVYRSRAQAYALLGQYDLAENDVLMAAKLDPDDPENQEALAAIRSRRQQAAEEESADAEVEGALDRYVDESAADATDYRYDGKTFDEWRNLWRHELKTERRIEAIAALAAFGRRAYSQEAAEAILDVAGEYDFRYWGDGLENRLKNAVAETFCKPQSGGIATDVWLPILVSRVRESEGADQRRWRDMLSKLLENWEHDAPEPHDVMIELAEDEAVGVQDEALYVLARGINELSDPKVVLLLRKALTGPKPSGHVLRTLAFKDLDVVPEQLDVLFHENPEIQAGARRVLQNADLEERWLTVYEPLAAALEDPDRSPDHLAAIRAIAVLWPYLNKEWARRPEIMARHYETMRSGAEELIPPTLWLLAKTWGSSDWEHVISQLQQRDSTRLTEDRVGLVHEAARDLGVEERAIFGR